MSNLWYAALMQSEPLIKWFLYRSGDCATSWPRKRVEDSRIICASPLRASVNTASRSQSSHMAVMVNETSIHSRKTRIFVTGVDDHRLC
jgi:hypothetical protein